MKKAVVFLSVLACVSSLLFAQDGLIFKNKPQAANPYVSNSKEQAKNSVQNLSKEQKAIKCLNEKGFVLYAVKWCPHCKEQKHKLKKYINQLQVVDCEKERRLCRKKRINGYPTLLLENENSKEINQGSLLNLAAQANCQL